MFSGGTACRDNWKRNMRVEEFTQPGDPLKFDYGYRNGVRGYLQAVALGARSAQAKVLAYTAERIRAKVPTANSRRITEIEPCARIRRHQFIVQLFEEQRIRDHPAEPRGTVCGRFEQCNFSEDSKGAPIERGRRILFRRSEYCSMSGASRAHARSSPARQLPELESRRPRFRSRLEKSHSGRVLASYCRAV